MSDKNPLLEKTWELLPFGRTKPEHWAEALANIVEHNHLEITKILKTQKEKPTFEGLVVPIEELLARRHEVLEGINILYSFNSNDDVRKAHKDCARIKGADDAWMRNNKELPEAYKRLRQRRGANLNADQIATLDSLGRPKESVPYERYWWLQRPAPDVQRVPYS